MALEKVDWGGVGNAIDGSEATEAAVRGGGEGEGRGERWCGAEGGRGGGGLLLLMLLLLIGVGEGVDGEWRQWLV